MKLIVEVETEGVRVGTLRAMLEERLRGSGNEVMISRKGTLPDPEREVAGTVYWRTAQVKTGTRPKKQGVK